jgi:hypothetical protein
LGSFDGEEDAAYPRDLMMLWCFLHGVAVHKSRGHGRGVLDLNGIKGLLSFRYADYKGELKDLRGIKTLEAIVQYIRQQ